MSFSIAVLLNPHWSGCAWMNSSLLIVYASLIIVSHLSLSSRRVLRTRRRMFFWMKKFCSFSQYCLHLWSLPFATLRNARPPRSLSTLRRLIKVVNLRNPCRCGVPSRPTSRLHVSITASPVGPSTVVTACTSSSVRLFLVNTHLCPLGSAAVEVSEI